MEIVKADIDANYDDRNIRGDRIEITHDHIFSGRAIVFRIFLSNEREDDYAITSVDIAELLAAVGKEVTKQYR